MKYTRIYIPIVLSLLPLVCTGNDCRDTISRAGILKQELSALAERDTVYNRAIDVSVVDFPVADLIRGMAISNNLSIETNIDRRKTITCNIRKVPIKDVLYLICTEKSLDARITGSIVSLSDYIPQPEIPVVKFAYDTLSGTLSFDFTESRLDSVARRFNAATGQNLIFPIHLADRPVSAFGTAMPIEEAVSVIASVNNLTAKHESGCAWTIIEGSESGSFSPDRIHVDSSGLVSAILHNADIADIVPETMEKLKRNYFIAGDISCRVNVDVDSLTAETFLDVLLTGTPVTWKETDGVYIFGQNEAQGHLADVIVYPMKYRTVERVIDIIPAYLKNGMEIKAFPDLNSLVISGNMRNAGRIRSFLETIDRSVPLIAIDVMIVDASNNSTQTIGLGLGVGSGQETTGGTVSPGVDFSLNAESLSRILGSFTGLSTINLGKVSQLFYADMQFLEEAGKIVLRSTPRLSTLNGHKAILKSGEVKYYKESQVNIIGTQNPLQSESYLWKNVEASFILDITPYVSLDSTITLNINLSQDEFTTTDEDDKYAPPGIAKRSFNSIIKVKDQEMVLLGGIEKNIRNNASRGLPFVARVPVLRAIFGKTNKQKTDSKLNIFIRPTIL